MGDEGQGLRASLQQASGLGRAGAEEMQARRPQAQSESTSAARGAAAAATRSVGSPDPRQTVRPRSELLRRRSRHSHPVSCRQLLYLSYSRSTDPQRCGHVRHRIVLKTVKFIRSSPGRWSARCFMRSSGLLVHF
jgi:hypothetical protein